MLWDIQFHECVSSTQDVLKDRALAGAAEGLCVQAALQTQGRGRHGRIWDSRPGNLFLSVLLRPQCEAALVGQISLLAGLAVFETVRDVLGRVEGVLLKWPNDLLLHGKKCAGILLETELDSGGVIEAVFLGVGVNIVSAPQETGIALQDYAEDTLDVAAIRDMFLERLCTLYVLWQEGGFEEILGRWRAAAHEKGALVSVKVGETLEKGRFHDIDRHGRLILLQETGALKIVAAGDVYLPQEEEMRDVTGH